ncbi:GNAT family N-acetyltransferase [Lewinella sp. IMCC34191]|uniref:GNAT family N-acetyltransferase n=1 Tax=Lewinella sp. IMCC34191 TaxID=2259172 RepID=UPI000E248188|nr:GNAT family N-acetyltransferase [Lewinella sp. IMCC34191]
MNSANVRILPATPDDVATIERLARKTWPDTFGDILSAAQIEYMLQMMYRPDALLDQMQSGHVFHLLLASDESFRSDYSGQSRRFQAVGYVSHETDQAPGATKIHKLYVLPEMQGRGFGRLLIDKVESIATRNGQLALKLDVNYQNPAIRFYERMGFEKVEQYTTEIGEGYLMEDWRMVKLLS